MRRLAATVAAVVLFSGILALPTALAHVFEAHPGLAIHRIPAGVVEPGERVRVFGRLRTGRSICRQDRVVRLLMVRPGRDRLLATDRTDAEGEYLFILRPRRNMTVYTVVRRSLETSYGHSHDCRRARSKNLSISVG